MAQLVVGKVIPAKTRWCTFPGSNPFFCNHLLLTVEKRKILTRRPKMATFDNGAIGSRACFKTSNSSSDPVRGIHLE